MNQQLLTFALLLLCSLRGFAQDSEPAKLNAIDTASIETKCACLQKKYDLKREILDNTHFDENGNLLIDSTIIEKRQYTFLTLKAVSEKCSQIQPNPETAPCPVEAKLTELNDDFELILRVIEMNAQPHGHY